MRCAEKTFLTNKDYLEEFNRKSAELRIPLLGSLDLTHRCNLKCVHCYVGNNNFTSDIEMSSGQIMSLIDEVTEAGCLYLLLTGGEPLIRKDFAEIYSHAKRNGLLVTVFTNGTLITEHITEVFEELPPRVVEISLYGASEKTYEKITGIPGSFGKCRAGIERLLENNIPVRLKTILMTHNDHEFFAIENIAREYGIKFRFDAAIFPRFDGDRSPVDLRVSPEDVIEKEFSDGKRAEKWREYFAQRRGQSLSNNLYNCGAGSTGFHIDPYGNLQPCVMTTRIQHNVIKNGFLNGWQNVMPRIQTIKAGNVSECNKCEKRQACDFCPSFFELETGAEDNLSEYLCSIGNNRFHRINSVKIERKGHAR